MTDQPSPSAYAAAGVDIAAGERAVELMRNWVETTRRSGGADRPRRLRRPVRRQPAGAPWTIPVLATSTDGVGTKVAIAQAMDRHDTIGFDLVGMVVDDLVVCGAEPLFMTDYIACGKVEPERIAAIVKGIAEACSEAGCALIGGETAEHPGLLEPARVRPGRGGHGGGRARQDPGRRPGPAGRRRARLRVLRPALQRLLAGPPGVLHHGRAGSWTGTSRSSAAPSGRSCWSRHGSTPRTCSR